MTIKITVGFRANSSLEGFLRRLIALGPVAADDAAREGAEEVKREAIRRTPVGDEAGQTRGLSFAHAKNSWVIRRGRQGWEVVNTAKHSTVLEYGGFPVRPLSRAKDRTGFIRGGAILGGLPPAKKTRRPRQVGGLPESAEPFGLPFNPNVSRKAPSGMLRISMKRLAEKRFTILLEKHLRRQIRRAGGVTT